MLLVSATGASAAGPTYVYQNISTDTTWNEAGSPYIVNQTIYVQQGVTLTVGPNVEVRADTSVSINVNGSLIANGEAARMVDFTQNSSMWSGIVANNGSVINFNYVNLNHAVTTGILVKNTGIFDHTIFSDIGVSAIAFNFERKDGILTVTNCDFSFVGSYDIVGQIRAWSNASYTNTTTVPITIQNNYFGPGLSGYAVRIDAIANSTVSSTVTLNNNIVVNNNIFNVAPAPAILIQRLISANDNATMNVNGDITINRNRFNSGGPAVTSSNIVNVFNIANSSIRHYNHVNINSRVVFSNNDVTNAASYGIEDLYIVNVYGDRSSAINDPFTATGNNFTVSGDAAIIQRVLMTYENATLLFTGDILVDRNRMVNIGSSVFINKNIAAASDYADAITYTGSEKISNNTVILGSGPLVNDVLTLISTGYGHLTYAAAMLVSDNIITNIGANVAVSSVRGVIVSGHSVASVADAITIINNNVNIASDLFGAVTTFVGSDRSTLTVTGNILVQHNEGDRLGSSGISLSPFDLIANDDATITLTSGFRVLDNTLNTTTNLGVNLVFTERAQQNGIIKATMPVDVLRNKFSSGSANGVQLYMTNWASDNATAYLTGAITIDSNQVGNSANAFYVWRTAIAEGKFNSNTSLVGDVVFTNNVMNTLTGKGLYLYDRVNANGNKPFTFTSSVTATHNTVHEADGRMIEIDRAGLNSFTNASLTIKGAITVTDNIAETCGHLISVDLRYTTRGNSTITATGNVLVQDNQASDSDHNGIEVRFYPASYNNSTMTVTSNIQVLDNSIKTTSGIAMDVERALSAKNNSTATMTGFVSISRNTMIVEQNSAFYVNNLVSADDNSRSLISGDYTVSNNTLTVYDNYGYNIDIEADAAVSIVGKVSTASYNGNVLIADNKANLIDATDDDNQFYINFEANANASMPGSTLGSKWANATLGNIQVLRNVISLKGQSGVGLEYDPDLMCRAAYGGSASVKVGTQLVANNQVNGIGNDLYAIKFDVDRLYAECDFGNATIASGAITIRDNTIDMKGNSSIGINVYNSLSSDIYAQAYSHWLASLKIDGGTNIIRNTIVMKGSDNLGICVDKGYDIFVQVDSIEASAILQYELNITNNVLTMPGAANIGILLEEYGLHTSYWDGDVTLTAGVTIMNNNVKLNSDTGEGMLLNIPLVIDASSFNGQATVSANVNVTNNIVTRGANGIHLAGSAQGTVHIIGNKITGMFETGILIENSNAVVEKNIITENEGSGIVLQNNLDSTNIVIGNNTVTHNGGFGLWITESNGVSIYNGNFEENVLGGINVPGPDTFMPLAGSQVKWTINAATSVKGNDVRFFGDVEIMRSGILTLDSVNDFTLGAADTGVTQLAVDIGGSMIVLNSNMYSDNDRGLFLVYGGLQMTSSSMNQWSELYLANTSTARISACTISGNDRNGIYIDGAKPTISSTSIMMNGKDGIFVGAGSKPMIKSCIIAMNERGIYARNANLDNVIDNIFMLNTVAGVYADGVVGRIHANIFLQDKNEIFVYNSVVSVEDNELGYARLVDQVAQYSTVLSLFLSYMNESDASDLISGLTAGSLSSGAPMLLGHVGVYAVNSDVTCRDNTYGMLTYALYAENSTISFNDVVKENTILLQWLNSNLDSRNITIPTFVYNGIYAIDSQVTVIGGSIQCLNDALFLDDSSAVISNSALNASRFDIYSVHQSNVSISTTALDGKLKVDDNGWIAWLNQFTVIVKDENGKLVSGAPVTVVDGGGKLIASGNTSSNGQFLADVIGWTQTGNGKQGVTTPYWVNATVGGKTLSQTVDGSQSQTITAQAQKSVIDTIMLPLLLIIALVVVIVVIAVVLRIRKT